ncbi:MAG: hypothetical protein WB608_14050 [Terracidiphilus sp.]
MQLSWRCIDLLRGKWQQSGGAQNIVVKVFGLIPLGLLLFTPDHGHIILKHPGLDQPHYIATLNTINQNIRQSLLLICAIVVLQLGWDIAKMITAAYRERAALR